MEFLGIGAPELIFILILALILLGPKDMQQTGRTIGRWLNQLVTSDGWRALQRTSREIRNLPTTLMRDANLEELGEMGRDLHNAIDPNWGQRRMGGPPATPAQARSGQPTKKADGPPERDPSSPPEDTEEDA